MGKQGRRKQRQKRQQQRKQDHQHDHQKNERSANPSSAVHQLRHADPKIRQNALIALQATVLRPSPSKKVSLTVLQAVREQVLDQNLECAGAAAECLAQYLSFTHNVEHQASTTAGWTIVFLSRLEHCHQAIQSKAKSKQWYALAAPCLRALCKLIEINEKALEQIMTTATQQSQQNPADSFLATIFGLLQDAAVFETSNDQRWNQWVQETAIYAARTLHSSLDENPDMVERIHAHYTDANSWAILLNKLPDLARLHLCGSLVSMHQIRSAEWQSTCLVQYALPTLATNLVVHPERLASIEQEYAQAVTLWKTQKEDAQLEGEIVQKIQQRKEPVRLVARRQKEVDRGSKPIIKEEDTKDGEQAIEDSLTAWNSIVLPLQVALEVTANLLSCFLSDENAMEQDASAQQQMKDSHDKAIHQALIQGHWAENLLKILQSLCVYQASRSNLQQREKIADDSGKDALVLTADLQDTISKSAACMANCVLSRVLESCHFPQTWQILRTHATASGVSSVLVVLAQNGGGSGGAIDTTLIQELLQPRSKVPNASLDLASNESDLQRDGICLLAFLLNEGGPGQSRDFVIQSAREMVRLSKEGADVVKIEILNAVMDLWGQDDFFPDVLMQEEVLSNFRKTLANLSINKNLDVEAEEILYNAERFVEYKLGR